MGQAFDRFRPEFVTHLLAAVSHLLKLPAQDMWISHDAGADVLYVSFRKPQGASDSRMRDDGIIVHRRGKEIVGLTILDASTR